MIYPNNQHKEKKKINSRTIIRIPDKLWDEIRSILQNEKPSKTGGRPIVTYGKVLDSILYILKNRMSVKDVT